MKHQGVPRRARRLLQSAASAALMVLLLRWACRDVDLLVVAERLSSLSAPWLALLVLLNLAALGVRGWRWMLLVRPFAPEVTCLDTSLALGICYAANVPVPRSGEFVRAVSLRWSRGAGITATLATVVVERVLDLAWLVVFLGLSLAVLRGRLELLFPGVSLLCAGVLAALSLIHI